jgi:hypothetical protein
MSTRFDPTCQIMGMSRIQEERNRITFPEAIQDVGLFRGDGSKEIAYWGYNPDQEYILFSNSPQLRDREGVIYIGHTTVGRNRLLPIRKEFFPDYGAKQLPSPVRESNRLSYGQRVYVGIMDALPDSRYIGRLLHPSRVNADLLGQV